MYSSYRGDRGWHRIRCIATASLSVIVALFCTRSASAAYNVMSLSISVLAGFTFTALFSNHAITTHELPSPVSEDDRRDIFSLIAMGENFRARAKFFIAVTVIDLLAMLLSSMQLRPADFCESGLVGVGCLQVFINLHGIINHYINISSIFYLFGFIVRFISFYLFIESLYTFYRLTETIMAIMDARRKYFEARKKA